MKRLLALLLLTATFVVPAMAADQSPDQMVKTVTEEVLSVVKYDKDIQSGNTKKAIALVETKVVPYFNFTHMTQLAVGKDWRKATPEQQSALTLEFKNLLVRTYSNALSSYKDQSVSYKAAKQLPGGTDVVVRSAITPQGGKPIIVDYTLEQVGGGWKVYDITVEGVSLLTNYRGTFEQELRNGGVDGLIQSLAAKNKSFDTGNKAAEKK
jgi:phospholipid transport system substrate-binding protein